jgi:NAD(P)-dependent dehydrogenase (short-subunit alcohol dehydrogenase family)
MAVQKTRFIKRDGLAEDIANVVYFLSCGDSGFVTGQTISADGGSVMH